MPKMTCTCGNILSYSRIPCDIEYKFISDVDYEGYSGSIDAEVLYQKMKSFLMCPKCKRLWLYWNGFDEKPKEYVPIIE